MIKYFNQLKVGVLVPSPAGKFIKDTSMQPTLNFTQTSNHASNALLTLIAMNQQRSMGWIEDDVQTSNDSLMIHLIKRFLVRFQSHLKYLDSFLCCKRSHVGTVRFGS